MIQTGHNFARHYSSAIVACAKLWPDWIITFQVRTAYIFTRFELWTYCAKLVPHTMQQNNNILPLKLWNWMFPRPEWKIPLIFLGGAGTMKQHIEMKALAKYWMALKILVHMTSYNHGSILHMVDERIIEIFSTFFLHSFCFWWSNQVTVSQMAWQLSSYKKRKVLLKCGRPVANATHEIHWATQGLDMDGPFGDLWIL